MGKTARANLDAGAVVKPRLACCTTGPSGIIINAAVQFTNPIVPGTIFTGKYLKTCDLTIQTETVAPVIPAVVVEASDPVTDPTVPPFLFTGPVVLMNYDPTEPGIDADPWQPNTQYIIGINVIANGNIYICVKNGESAATGTGPSGTGANITDNLTAWTYEQPAVVLVPTALNERYLERLHPPVVISEANVPPGDYPGDLPPEYPLKQSTT